MAVVLDPDEEGTWLSEADPDTHLSLLEPGPAEAWHSHPVSTRTNDPSNDDPDLIAEVEPDQQTGLDEFV